MKKPVFAMLLGAVLGAFDGLSALISAPQEAPNIVGHRDWLDGKGPRRRIDHRVRRATDAVAGGDRRRRVGRERVLRVARDARRPLLLGDHPAGSIVGLIVGFATAKYRGPVRSSTA
jgi:hypothetical protein